MAGASRVVEARQAGACPAGHEAFRAGARRAHGDGAGTRALIKVLLLHRHLPAADVLAGISAALSVGAASADVVAVEARKAGDARRGGMPQPAQPGPARPAVSSLTRRRLAALPGDTRPPPAVGRC